MTVEEFKKENPDLAHLEGNELWDAMTLYGLEKQSNYYSKKKNFFKKYTLRWVFYRKIPNIRFNKNNWSASKRCSVCKKGVSSYFAILNLSTGESICNCPHCRNKLLEEDNKNFSHKIYIFANKIKNIFWSSLSYVKLVRSDTVGRYDLSGDECYYVDHWSIDKNSGNISYVLKKRKWWEYIFIEKKYSF